MAFANVVRAVAAFEPPLTPSAEEARQLLENELRNPIYQPPTEPWYQRILNKIIEFLGNLSGEGFSAVSLLWILLVVFAFFVVVFVLAGPVRRARKGATRQTLFESSEVSSDEYAHQAKRAAAQGNFSRAAVEMYRAIVRRAEEDVLISQAPGRTAHEAATAMGEAVAYLKDQYSWASVIFDTVEYGSGSASSQDVAALDDLLEHTKAAVRTDASSAVAGPATELSDVGATS